jgi:pSer/pThr/pTyr-binding forkhead associated (FHA) protein
MSRIINIGRGAENDVIIDHSYISNQHAQLIIDNNKVFLNDLNSKNGCYINDKKLEGLAQLESGDIVKLGWSVFDWGRYSISLEVKEKSFGDSLKSPKPVAISLKIALLVLVGFYLFNEIVGAEKVISNAASIEPSEDVILTTSQKDNEANKTAPNVGDIKYDFSCVISDGNRDVAEISEIFNGIRTGIIDAADVEVSVTEEMEFGNSNHDQLLKGTEIVNDERSHNIEEILNSLVIKLQNPRGFSYKIFLVESNEVNAWTCGGLIYFTTAMYDFVKSNDEVAGIVSHEIYHNELGHINKMLKAKKISQQTIGGELGSIAASVDAVLHSPFGKRDESHCDFKGADLCILANYKSCDIVKLWARMSMAEGESTELSEFMSSHPVSRQRRDCLQNHLLKNYNLNCN